MQDNEIAMVYVGPATPVQIEAWAEDFQRVEVDRGHGEPAMILSLPKRQIPEPDPEPDPTQLPPEKWIADKIMESDSKELPHGWWIADKITY